MEDPRARSASGATVLVWVCFTLGAAYAGYAWYSYSGPFKWLAELQLKWFGEYEIQLTFLLTLVLMILPAGLLGPKGFRRWYWRGAQAEPVSEESRTVRIRRQSKVILALGLLSFPLGLGTGLIARWVWKEAVLTPLDLRGSLSSPQSNYVQLTGWVQTHWVYRYSEEIGGKREYAVVPVTETAWVRSSPVRYFVQTSSNRAFQELEPGGPQFRPLGRQQTPFLFSERFLVERNGLPGMVRERYLEAGANIAEPHYFLTEGQPTDPTTVFYICVTVGGILGLILTLSGIVSLINLRRMERH
jgi:hypothetical protein